MNLKMNAMCLALGSALLLSACGGGDGNDGAAGTNGTNGTNGSSGHTALIATAAIAAGAQCASGGTSITAGADMNDDGTLQAGEVTQTTVVCNGTAGVSGAMPLVTLTQGGPSQEMGVNTRYVVDSGGQVRLSLPSQPSVGDMVAVAGVGSAPWQLDIALGQVLIDPASGPIGTQPNWTDTLSGTGNWNPLATDGTGQMVFAGSRDTVNVSNDGGGTWSPSLVGAPGVDWRGIAASSSGSIVIAVGSQNAVKVSTDGGLNWTTPAGMGSISGSWERVGMSDDGATILLAGDFGGGAVFLSKDGGATFSQVPNLPTGGSWVSASVSADGSKLIATQNATVGQNGTVVSTDGGVTWVQATVPAGMHNSVVSADGSTFVGITHQGTDNSVYVSRDNGVTWTKSGLSVTQGNLLRVAVSADGRTIGASTFGGQTWLSFNGGTSWVGNGNVQQWYGLAVSGDGQRAFTADVQGSLPVEVAFPSVQLLIGQQYSAMTLQYMGRETWLFLDKAGSISVVSND